MRVGALGSTFVSASLVLAVVPATADAAEAAPQRILVTVSPVFDAWSDVAVTGKVQRQVGGVWQAAPSGTPVDLHYQDDPGGPFRTVKAGTGGAFRAVIVPGYGQITARVAGNGQFAGASAQVLARTTELAIDRAKGDTETTPSTLIRDGRFEMRRTLRVVKGAAPLPGRSVELWWVQRKGNGGIPTTGWQRLGTFQSDSKGRVVARGTARTNGYLRLVHKGDQYYAPLTQSFYAPVFYRTAITKFNASPEPARKGQWITLKGKLLRWNAKGWSPLKGGWISAEYRPKGSKRWYGARCYNGGNAADAKGWFKAGCQATKDATWKAYYLDGDPANVFMGEKDLSAQAYDYVDVR